MGPQRSSLCKLVYSRRHPDSSSGKPENLSRRATGANASAYFRVAAQLELDFNSVERIVEYVDVPQEAPAIIEKSRPPAYWPSSSGGLVVEDLVVRYAADLPPAINGISFEARPAEKIGVVSVILAPLWRFLLTPIVGWSNGLRLVLEI